MERESFVSISEASQILGVSEPTLRMWTDEGKIGAFITPGGHRRYSVVQLRRFVTARGKASGIKDLAAGLAETTQLHGEIDRTYLAAEWSGRLSPESRAELAGLGRSLLRLLIKVITEPSRREAIVDEVRTVGDRLGDRVAALGLPLTDSVQTFIRHREPIIEAAALLMKKREGFSRRIVDSIPLVESTMDEALVSLVAAYQRRRGISAPERHTMP